MFPLKHPGKSLLIAAGIYAMLMAPWPGLQRGYAALFRWSGNIAFARFWFWPEANVRFLDLETIKPEDLPPDAPNLRRTLTQDTVLELRKRSVPTVGYLRTSSRYIGYSPTVTILALVLATGMSWRRRGWAVALSLCLVHLFILARLTLTLAAGGFAIDKPYALGQPGAFWSGTLIRLESLFSDNPTVSFVMPVLIWFLVLLIVPRDPESAQESSMP